MSIEEFVNQLNIDDTLSKNRNTTIRGNYFKSILTKEVLQKLLIDERYSAFYLYKSLLPKITIRPGYILSLAREYGIKTRNIHEQNSSEEVKDRRRRTLLIRYGVEHHLQRSSPFYKKRNKTVRKKYGVSNVFQLPKVRKKSIETMIKKYGVTSPVFMEGYVPSNGRRSKIHRKIEKCLDSLGISFQSEYGSHQEFRSHNSFLNREYSPIVDIFIPSKNIIIEIYGDYYHANPDKYKNEDFIKKWGGIVKAYDVREFDKCRKKQLESFGYKVFELWESNIPKKDTDIKSMILSIL